MMHFLSETIRFAWRSLTSYKLRMLLTVSGISIGIFSITLIFTLVNSMQYSLVKNLSALGNTVLFVHNWPWKDNSEDWFKYFNRPKMSYGDYTRLKNNLSDVVGVSYSVRKVRETVKGNGITLEGIRIIGATYDFGIVQDLAIEEGRYFTPIEMQNGRNVCVVGWTVAMALHGTTRCIGKPVVVKGKRLTIVGVCKRMGANLFGDSQDDQILMPYQAIERFYNTEKRGIDKIVTIKVTDYKLIDRVESEVIGLMRLQRGLKPGVEDNFSINKQETIMNNLQKIFDVLNTGGSIISLFSLLVGGFGIMNIMFVSVKERTKEIGIQKALGARRYFILTQFLAEAVMLSLVGGILGLMLLFIVAGVGQWASTTYEMGLAIIISPKDLLIGVGLSILIGLLSGLIPSWQAARLDPVDAIRSK
jgi:putative ABC transport system permease protein